MQHITFCINTARNEFEYIKLLFKSLELNLNSLEHEFLVFVDSDNQGTTEWLINQKTKFPNLKILKNELPIPYGYQRNINEMFLYASHDIVSYLQSDMVVCKNYDIEILKHLQPNMVLCSTRIEPPLHGNSGEKLTFNFGLYPTEFKFDEFVEYSERMKETKFIEYFFAPFTLYKSVWNDIGGHDTMFRRSREDSDILNRLILSGVKIIQIWNANVYHFTCTSSRGVDWFNPNNKMAIEKTELQSEADKIELRRFIKKWGVFSHGNPIDYFYKISANLTIDDTNYKLLENIEVFFDKIYVFDKIELFKKYDTHSIANKLLNVTDDIWNNYSYMFNECNLQKIESGKVLDDDVIIEFDLSKLTNKNFSEFINNIQHIIHQTDEVGVFKYDIFIITINRKNNLIGEKIKVKNPIINNTHLYSVL